MHVTLPGQGMAAQQPGIYAPHRGFHGSSQCLEGAQIAVEPVEPPRFEGQPG